MCWYVKVCALIFLCMCFMCKCMCGYVNIYVHVCGSAYVCMWNCVYMYVLVCLYLGVLCLFICAGMWKCICWCVEV